MADTQIFQYLIEPGEEPSVGLEVFDIPVCSNKGLLRQVHRIFAIAHKTQRDKICVFHIPVHKNFKRP